MGLWGRLYQRRQQLSRMTEAQYFGTEKPSSAMLHICGTALMLHTLPLSATRRKTEVRGLNPELSFTSEVLHTSWFHRGLTPLRDSRLNLLRIEPQAPLRPDAGATPCAHATHGRPTSGPAWTSSCSYPGELEPLRWRIEQRSVFRPSADLE